MGRKPTKTLIDRKSASATHSFRGTLDMLILCGRLAEGAPMQGTTLAQAHLSGTDRRGVAGEHGPLTRGPLHRLRARAVTARGNCTRRGSANSSTYRLTPRAPPAVRRGGAVAPRLEGDVGPSCAR